MPRMMYFDCFSGAAGDMVLGALLDAGLPLDALRNALGSLGVGQELRVTRVLRAGISATHVEVLGDDKAAHRHSPEDPPAHDHAHLHARDHSHDHDRTHGQERHPSAHHVHRSLDQIAHLIGHSTLSAGSKARAVAMFRRLAEAEAAIHHVPVAEVHLHEVGAIDSIIDIVGVVFALDWFGIDDIVASPLNVGGGTVKIAHGTFPVPAPATLRLLEGIPMYSGGVLAELVTPTGALIMSTYAKQFGPLPAMAMERVGYGAGTRDFENVPNVLRVVIGERVAASASTESASQVLKVEAAIDDMSPQLFGPVSDALFGAGALDVFLTPISMKKGRPGTLLTVLAPVSLRETVCALLFRETTTIGVRFEQVERETLDRTWVDVATPGGSVRIKVARRRGAIVNAAPEFEDCVRVASATGRPIKEIQAEAMHAWRRIDQP
jgi:uncharacterized protein (TIGR00299 family) protein